MFYPFVAGDRRAGVRRPAYEKAFRGTADRTAARGGSSSGEHSYPKLKAALYKAVRKLLGINLS